jgi:uncharacterized protein DUF4412
MAMRHGGTMERGGGFMRTVTKGIALAGALWLSAGAARAADGLLIVQKTTRGTDAPQIHQTQIDSTRMRAESVGPTGGKHVVMFDGTKQVLTMMDPDKKTYQEITKADVDSLAAQMAPAMAQMQEMLKSMPPEQRAKYEALMKGRGGALPGAAAPKTVYKKVGTDKVGKWTCDKYEGYKGEQKTADICTVDPKVLGFTASDLDVAKQMATFFKSFMPQMADQGFHVGTVGEQGFSGVPVRQTFTISGQQTVMEITDVSRQAFPDSVFQVPAGYQKTTFGGLGRGRR